MTERKRIPRGGKKTLEPLEEQIGQDGVARFMDDHKPRDASVMAEDAPDQILVKPDQENVEDPGFKEKMANLEFMEEMVSIVIHDTAEKNADKRFEIAVNGNNRVVFERGKQYTVKRFIVEGLARAKPVHYSNEEYEENGIKGTRYPTNTGLRYGFSVIEDRHPRGAEWLRSVLAQP